MSSKFCGNCGTELTQGVAFCGNCGAKVLASQGKLESPSQNEKRILFIPRSSPSKQSDFAMKWRALSPAKRGFTLIVFAVAVTLIAFQSNGGSSSVSFSTPTDKVSGLLMTDVPGEYTDFSCSETDISTNLTCMLAISVQNKSNASIHLYGDIYALVDGKVFKASTLYGGIDYVSTDINPGEKQSATVSFDVPQGAMISDIFIADNADSGIGGAKVSLSLNKPAVVN
jgi:hypothetical protein